MQKFFHILFLTLILIVTAYPQSLTNLEVFYSLTDSLTNDIVNELNEGQNEIQLILNLGGTYSLFANHIKSSFEKAGKEIVNGRPEDSNIPNIDIVLEGAGVEYGEMFRDGWFGVHYITRYCTLFGNYMETFSNKRKQTFEYTFMDTVKVEDIKYLENESFQFTQAVIPPEPMLSGLAEPLIAVGTAAAVIILFFSVRSK